MEKTDKCKTKLSSVLTWLLDTESYSGTRGMEGPTASTLLSFLHDCSTEADIARALGCQYLSSSITPGPFSVPFFVLLLSSLSLAIHTYRKSAWFIDSKEDLSWSLHFHLSTCEIVC